MFDVSIHSHGSMPRVQSQDMPSGGCCATFSWCEGDVTLFVDSPQELIALGQRIADEGLRLASVLPTPRYVEMVDGMPVPADWTPPF